MFARYLKCQAFVLLCGGLVGPIFLAVFFALGADPMLKWMFWSGLLVTAADVLIALWLTNQGAQSEVATQHLESAGVLALAQVTSIAETGTRINDQPMVRLGLHIEGPGLTPFDSDDRVIASMVRQPMITGRKLVVLVDPATNKYQIDWDRSALVSGLMPAQFTLEEDGQTHDLSGQTGPLMDIMQVLKSNGIPMQGTIDIRSNPAVRRQVMDIVRSAVGAVADPPSHGPADERSVGQRLAALEELKARGVITDAEYAEKRRQIIVDL